MASPGWRYIVSPPDGVTLWHCRVALHRGAARWRNTVALTGGATPWRLQMALRRGAARWRCQGRSHVALHRGAVRWRYTMAPPCGATPRRRQVALHRGAAKLIFLFLVKCQQLQVVAVALNCKFLNSYCFNIALRRHTIMNESNTHAHTYEQRKKQAIDIGNVRYSSFS